MFTAQEKKRYFEQLFRENYVRLYYHALNFLNDDELAKDVVSDAFETVWKNNDRLEYSTSLLPFLFTLVRNACLDHLRHEKTSQRFIRYMLERPELEEDGKCMEYEMLIDRIHHAVDELPAQTRNVFKKCFLEGRKYQDVGAECGITVNTVKAHVMKALRLLREQFSNDTMLLFFWCREKIVEKK